LKPGNYARNQAKIKEDKINAIKYQIGKNIERKKKYEKVLKQLEDKEDDDEERENEEEESVSKEGESSDQSQSSSEEENEDEHEEEIIESSFIKRDNLLGYFDQGQMVEKYYVEFNIR